jgi:hypothetical protein
MATHGAATIFDDPSLGFVWLSVMFRAIRQPFLHVDFLLRGFFKASTTES